MLCEVQISGNFFVTWMTLNALALVALLTMSGSLFYVYYQRATFEKWQNKSNPKYPTPEIVRSEIIQMLKGMCSATLCPALSLYLAQHNHSQAFCGWGGYSVWYHLGTFLVCWIATDFWEFYYHRLGHTTQSGWDQHKYHHIFYNPSPFAVIADEYIDQFVRAAPLAIFPMLMPINMDLLFAQFVIFFYAYGVYLHWGYELPWLSAHHPIINTSFQHYCHHALSIKNKPMRINARTRTHTHAHARTHARTRTHTHTRRHRILLQALGQPLRLGVQGRVFLCCVRARQGRALVGAVAESEAVRLFGDADGAILARSVPLQVGG
eukprot:TRINITY_DN5285_c0_g3_i2.p1 TRINITY_DN5285_c0_g3~~TRINITY_DN5285_c0_g3_i2.p1  ORF type:complete len:330 (+),score=79.10 TRINITY_DN5285_c0_g3_i2:25-990(+)